MPAISIRRLHPHVELPRYQSDGAAGFDLAASEDVVVQPGQVVLVPTGLVIQAPPGHFLAIVARSSTPMKRGLMVANGVGIVDEDYCGPADEVKIEVVNFTQLPVTVRGGTGWHRGCSSPSSAPSGAKPTRDCVKDREADSAQLEDRQDYFPAVCWTSRCASAGCGRDAATRQPVLDVAPCRCRRPASRRASGSARPAGRRRPRGRADGGLRRRRPSPARSAACPSAPPSSSS